MNPRLNFISSAFWKKKKDLWESNLTSMGLRVTVGKMGIRISVSVE